MSWNPLAQPIHNLHGFDRRHRRHLKPRFPRRKPMKLGITYPPFPKPLVINGLVVGLAPERYFTASILLSFTGVHKATQIHQTREARLEQPVA